MSSEPTIRLDYENRAVLRGQRRRRLVRLGILLTVLVGAAWFVHKRYPHLWRQIQIRYQERRCARFTLPPDFVVYEEDPAEVAKLRACRDYTLESREVDPPSAVFHPPCLVVFGSLIPSPDDVVLVDSFDPAQVGTLFLHELRTPKGSR